MFTQIKISQPYIQKIKKIGPKFFAEKVRRSQRQNFATNVCKSWKGYEFCDIALLLRKCDICGCLLRFLAIISRQLAALSLHSANWKITSMNQFPKNTILGEGLWWSAKLHLGSINQQTEKKPAMPKPWPRQYFCLFEPYHQLQCPNTSCRHADRPESRPFRAEFEKRSPCHRKCNGITPLYKSLRKRRLF